MTDRGPATEAELRTELEALLRRARDSDVDVRGAWECQYDEVGNWDVVVTELRADRGAD